MALLSAAFDIVANDHASKIFHEVAKAARSTGDEADKASSRGSKFGTALHKAGTVAAVGLAAAGTAAIAFGHSSVEAFESNTKAAMAMQRAIGGSIEDASRLNFAAKESGVSQESFAKSLRLLEKNITAVAGKAGPGAKALASIGVSAKDAHGNMRPMADLLPDIADRFAKMPNGPEKTALALKLFGRAGLDMLPMLNRGKSGIQDLMAESDKFGLTVGQKNVADMKANIVQQREWHATLEGVKVQVGSALLPVLTAFTGDVRGKLSPAIHDMTGFLMRNKDTIIAMIGVVIRFLPQILAIAAAMKALTPIIKGVQLVTALLNATWLANPIGIVIVAVAALVAGLIYLYKTNETARYYITQAWNVIKIAVLTLAKIAVSQFQFIMNVFLTLVGVIINGAAKAFGWIPGLGPKLQGAADNFNHFKDNANKSIDNIKKNIDMQIHTAQADMALEALKRHAKQVVQSVASAAFAAAAAAAVKAGAHGGAVWGRTEAAQSAYFGAGLGFGVSSKPLSGALGRPVPQGIGTPYNGYPGHKGYDFLAPSGTPIRAVMNGVVVRDGWDSGGFGIHVRTRDADGNMTILGHMMREMVSVGQRVVKGQVIGISDSTGNSTGPHVHMERRHPPFGINNAYPFLRGYAGGGSFLSPGWAWVGERGPELAYFGYGGSVVPADRSRAAFERGQRSVRVVDPGRSRLDPADIATLAQAVREGAFEGARDGSHAGSLAGSQKGSYSGSREGSEDGIAGLAAAARRAARAGGGR